GKRIAYIPTAANGEQGWESWKEGGSWKIVNTLGADITVFQLEEYRNQNMQTVLEGFDIIWFAGGMPGYLMYWIKSVGLDKSLKLLLEKGAIYVGSSAGAMVASKSLDVATWGFVDNDLGAENMPGLGLVDFDIYPHYEDSLHEKIKRKFNGNKLYLLKNSEEIIIDNGNMHVIGEERVI
ncbi:MAG: Type 1 glutamine amidotransferase-like domain-containing protein, partial [Microgenomates group bacterium]